MPCDSAAGYLCAMRQTSRTLQETITSASPADVLSSARRFFSTQNGIYAAFPEQQSERHLTLRGQGGEEIAIGVERADGGTRVSASTYLFDQQVARFFSLLPPPAAGTSR